MEEPKLEVVEPTVVEHIVENVQKPKRILTEAQLLALKRGRETLAEKRKAQKEQIKVELPEEEEYPEIWFCVIT